MNAITAIQNLDNLKTCTRCGEQKPNTDEFFQLVTETRTQRKTRYLKANCKQCAVDLATKWRLDNLDRFRENATRRYRENGGREKQRKYLLEKKYGVTPEAYDSMLASQNGCCAICDREPDGIGRWDVLAVDHNHATGAVRGLLCAQCNAALGGFGDSTTILAAALEYLNE